MARPDDTQPIEDPRRLAAVAATHLLDTPEEAAFDDLTGLAATLLDAPFALATIVDPTRAWWKSHHGIPVDGPRESTVEDSFCQHVLATGDEVSIGDAEHDPRSFDLPAISEMGVRAWAGVPLCAPDGEILGTFCVADTVTRNWADADMISLRVLAAAAGREIALRSAMTTEHELRTRAENLASTLQESLMPPALPAVEGLDVAARFHAAGRGDQLVGDFYDLFRSGPRRWSVLMGDVCGKGVEAAKIAALARNTVSAAAMRQIGPAEILVWLNDVMLARFDGRETFLTAVYATVEVEAGSATVRLAGGGHVPPIVRRADGTTQLIELAGSLIGIFADVTPGEATVHLGPGDALVLYTDGVIEARRDHVVFGENRLLEMVRAADGDAQASAQAIVAAALEHCHGDASDDAAVLVLRVPSRP